MRWIRPILMLLLMVGLFASTTWFVQDGKMNVEVYLAMWTPIVVQLASHLFAERSALKIPGIDT